MVFPSMVSFASPLRKKKHSSMVGWECSSAASPACRVVTAICVRFVSVSAWLSRTRFCPTPWAVGWGRMSWRCISIKDISCIIPPSVELCFPKIIPFVCLCILQKVFVDNLYCNISMRFAGQIL